MGVNGHQLGQGRDGVVPFVIDRFDRCLRRHYRVIEFTNDPDCLLRIALQQATKSVLLRDGTTVQAGDMVGDIHLWNEHLPRFPQDGPSFAWARKACQQTAYSLRLLADYVEHDPAWRPVGAFYADVPVPIRRSLADVQRIGDRFGFECLPQLQTVIGSLRALGESFLLWGLAAAYNPAALHRQQFVRRRQQIWISRPVLVERYCNHAIRHNLASTTACSTVRTS